MFPTQCQQLSIPCNFVDRYQDNSTNTIRMSRVGSSHELVYLIVDDSPYNDGRYSNESYPSLFHRSSVPCQWLATLPSVHVWVCPNLPTGDSVVSTANNSSGYMNVAEFANKLDSSRRHVGGEVKSLFKQGSSENNTFIRKHRAVLQNASYEYTLYFTSVYCSTCWRLCPVLQTLHHSHFRTCCL